MKIARSNYLPTLLTIMVVALAGFSSIQEEGPGETMARMVKLGEKFATPGAEHVFLQQLAGEWHTETSTMGLPSESGSAHYEMLYGNRFLDGEHTGAFMSIPFIGHVTIGFDNYKHKYVASFFDNLGTSIRTAEGVLHRNGTTLSLWGTMDEWMTDEHDKPVMYRYRVIDENHFVFEVHDLAIGEKKSLVITVDYARVSK